MKLGVITDGISRDFEHALNVMAEYELRYPELQFVWDREVGDHDAGQVARIKTLLDQHDMEVSCISRAQLWRLARIADRNRRCRI